MHDDVLADGHVLSADDHGLRREVAGDHQIHGGLGVLVVDRALDSEVAQDDKALDIGLPSSLVVEIERLEGEVALVHENVLLRTTRGVPVSREQRTDLLERNTSEVGSRRELA